MEKETGIEKDLEAGQDNANFLSITSRSSTHRESRLSSKASVSRTQTQTSQRSRCYGGEDGYAVNFEDDEAGSSPDRQPDIQQKREETSPFEVRWEDAGPHRHDGDEEDQQRQEREQLDARLNPRRRSILHKWLIVLVVSASSLCVTCTSSLYTSTYNQIVPEFHSSKEVATLGLSLFVIGLGIGPMVLAPLSEFYGRRPVYIVSFAFFIVFLLPCALARNMATLLVGRFLNGLAGSAFLSVAGGTVGDMFTKAELSTPMMVYTASPFIGPEIGPLIGGFINEYAVWRWSFWTLMVWSGVQLTLIVVCVPETYHPVLLRIKAQRLRMSTGDTRWTAPIEVMERSIASTILLSCQRPFQLLFLEPMCLNLCLLSALLLGIIYLFFGAFPLVFGHNHGFKLWQIGLTFLGLFVGMMLGIALNGVLWHAQYSRLVRNKEENTGVKGASEPEFRLPPTIAGAVLVPIALFGFAWTTYPSVHWIVPIIFSGIFGLGTVWSFSGVFTFLVECYPLYAASALAANSFARSSFAAAFPLFGIQMYDKLGYQWATSVLAFLSLAMTPFPYIFFVYGKQLRGSSTFAAK